MADAIAAAIIGGAAGLATSLIGVGLAIYRGTLTHFLQLQADDASRQLESHKSALDLQLERLKGDLARPLEAYKAELADAGDESRARREYQFEAQKRLYAEYQPLRFVLLESAQEGLYRVESLARSARNGDLTVDAHSWLDKPDYYLYSTIYYLLRPAAVHALLRWRLTLVDLEVDPRIKLEYALAKQAAMLWTEDFHLAAWSEAPLRYDPFVADWPQRREADPEVYWRQGIALGSLDKVVALLIDRSGARERLLDYGEFEALARQDIHRETIGVAAGVLQRFHPDSRPVFWRVLLVQAHLWRLLIHVQDHPGPLDPALSVWTDESLARLVHHADGRGIDDVRATMERAQRLFLAERRPELFAPAIGV